MVTESDICRVEGNFVKPCKVLNTSVDRNRVELLTLANMDTFKHTRSMVVLKAGEWAKRGIVMRFCPFCGVNISEHLMTSEDHS